MRKTRVKRRKISHETERTKTLKQGPSIKSSVSEEEEVKRRQVLASNTEPSLILELPTCILADILSRLSFKTLSVCRCVCKTWYYLTASPDFDQLRFRRSDMEVFMRRGIISSSNRTLYLLDFKTLLAASPPRNYRDRQKISVNKRIFLPKPDERFSKELNLTKVEYDIVNSCNGLMCLCKTFLNDPCIVLNPITGEFITIPESDKKSSRTSKVICGFGCSLRSNVYKIVRIFYCDSLQPDGIVEVYTLGTDTWRTIGNARWSIDDIHPEFLNGAVHWLNFGTEIWGSILAFDFEDEQFRVFPPPSCLIGMPKNQDGLYYIGLSVWGRCLVICQVEAGHVHIWVMKDYGFHESWTEAFSIEMFALGHIKPLKCLESGDLVLVYASTSLEFYNPIQKRLRRFEVHDYQSARFSTIALVPSFASLSDVVGGGDLTVHNIKTRWTESELLEDAKGFILLSELRSHWL